MTEELPDRLLTLIHACIPTFQAAEALLFLAANRDRDFSVEEIVVAMRPKVITAAALEECRQLFTAGRLVTEIKGRLRFNPQSIDLERSVCDLSQAYHERPVTVIITIYQMAGGNIPPLVSSSRLRTD
jgi:hypothetical protein